MRSAFLLLTILGESGFATLFAQTLEVTPQRVMVDKSSVIRASGLQPQERVTIEAELADRAGATWRSRADFVADDRGMLDLSQQAPVSGSYAKVSAMGLVWSMRPVGKGVNVYPAPEHLGTQVIRFRLLRDGETSASAQLHQISIAEGVKRMEVRGAIHGVLFEPEGAGPHPGMLVLGGSEGGAPEGRAAWLASHGYVALALAYFRYEGLSPKLEAIPLEYFGQAIGWMMGRPEIARERIGVMGTSRGGELALQLGSIYPQIKTVVAYVPANVRYPACCGGTARPYAWTWKGNPLGYMTFRDEHNPARVMEATIQVEKIHGPVLVISGDEDGIWESTRMANAVLTRLKAAHFAYPFEHLSYPHAGHMAGRPVISPKWHGSVKHPVSGREENFGGTPEGEALSTVDSIPKVLDFLQKGLDNRTSQP